MNIVFGGGLWPIGQLVGFVEAPYGEAVAAMRRWMDRLGERRSERDLADAPILEHLSALAPLEAPWTLRRPRRLTIAEARAEQNQGGQDRSSARP